MEERYLLELRGVSRRISSEFYLRGINLALRPGEVHALVGATPRAKAPSFPRSWAFLRPTEGRC